MKKISPFIAILVLATTLATPLLASAQNVYCPNGTVVADSSLCPTVSSGSVNQQWTQYYRDTIVWAVNFVLVPILMAVAFIVFLWGVFNYFILGAANDEKRKEGRQFVLWGIIGFVIIMSIWGLVNIVKDTLVPSTAGSTRPNYPTL